MSTITITRKEYDALRRLAQEVAFTGPVPHPLGVLRQMANAALAMGAEPIHVPRWDHEGNPIGDS